MSTLFTNEDLRTPRLSSDLKSWVETMLKSFSNSKDIIDLRNNSAKNSQIKKLKEEAFPLALYAFKKYPNDYVHLKANSGSCDAEIRNLDGALIEKIEVSFAIDGEKEAFLNKQLECRRQASKEDPCEKLVFVSVPNRAQFEIEKREECIFASIVNDHSHMNVNDDSHFIVNGDSHRT